ncbi:hypothetical protein NDU88_004531 [Pleurodeles waltl]|uniref:Uncharacterized protein n=1 Tax=Pleurodeles waltl TaxID=8319 RepID=A0AAV7T7V7_PLEWA|nr:hypothetical protein NDU88_004531 [Pleurodeles waltl]
MLIKVATPDYSHKSGLDTKVELVEAEKPVTRSFLEELFASLKDDLQTVKRELAQDMKTVWKDLKEIRDRVTNLEDSASSRDEELEYLQKDVICLNEQHVDLQAHVEYLENRSRCNNICIKGIKLRKETTSNYTMSIGTVVGKPQLASLMRLFGPLSVALRASALKRLIERTFPER